MSVILLSGAGWPEFACPQETAPEKEVRERDPELVRMAADALWRLERAIKRDAYPSARVALNVWRSVAMDAGTFDPERYQAYREQIYRKSIEGTLAWFELSLQRGDLKEATYALKVYRVHAEAIDAFDEALHARMVERVAERRKSLSEEAPK